MVRFALFADSSRRIAEADSVAVIGLGRFGSALALELMAAGTEVLGIDTDEDLVQSHNGELTQVVRADATKEEVLRQLAVDEFDRVVIAIGQDLKASILTASLLIQLKVPVICVIIGEGASGGALGIGVGDRVFMLENTWYTVISPESCSSILWRSWEQKEIAASQLKLTADDMHRFGLIDDIIPEPDRKSTRLNSSHTDISRMPSSA